MLVVLLNFFLFLISFKIGILNTNINMAAGFLKRCPSCLRNLVRHLCDFTCNPHQSDFIEVTALENKKTKEGVVGKETW